MPEFNIAVAATFTAQTLGAIVLALLLLSFHRQYGKSYLLHWTFACAALAVFNLASVLTTVLDGVWHYPAHHPFVIATRLAGGVAGWLEIGWLLFGVFELVRRRPVRLLDAQRILLGLTVIGLLAAFFDQLRAAAAAIAFLIAAVALWRARHRREGVGFAILSGAFALYGIIQLRYLTPITYLGYIDFLMQAVLGIGMIASLLEDEREAAELAADEIEHLAYHDALTGLPNRPLFVDRLIVALAQAHRAQQKLALFFLDLDRFKDINDSLGHSTGDALLKSVAERIRGCVREGDTVGRFGGDEFTLLIPRVESVDDAARMAQKITEALQLPFFIHDRELFVTTSIGVSLFPGDGHDPETLIRNADTAMYRAKEQGRDNYQLYAPAMNARALERLALENMLRKALSQNELVLHYQPLIDARTERIVGTEALVRWNHPEQGLLSPARFISVAELSGLIIPIGQWVLQTACRQIGEWNRLDPGLTMSVNLSARQFAQPDLVQQVRAVLAETGIDPACLQLEITESNAMQNAESSMFTLRELRALGVKIAMDDFGTGYSSLNYLKRFPIDTLKLDQAFVHDITSDTADAAIVSAVIAMAHSLELTVVAEGVETAEQLEMLRQKDCDLIQGFYYSRPIPAGELEELLQRERRLNREPAAQHGRDLRLLP
ncbi:MAG TPA: EAL domain-containing protein [Thermoanaerobaculia bacterium]|jgi:diguanylate cyclase (GGDEF)-like protein